LLVLKKQVVNIAHTAGGPAANLFTADMLILFWPSGWITAYWFIVFSLIVGVGNLIPLEIDGKPSDGFIIRDEWRKLRKATTGK
jgi:hypothetical protein